MPTIPAVGPGVLLVIVLACVVPASVAPFAQEGGSSPADHRPRPAEPEDAPIWFDPKFREYEHLLAQSQGAMPSPHQRIENLLRHPLLAKPAGQPAADDDQ